MSKRKKKLVETQNIRSLETKDVKYKSYGEFVIGEGYEDVRASPDLLDLAEQPPDVAKEIVEFFTGYDFRRVLSVEECKVLEMVVKNNFSIADCAKLMGLKQVVVKNYLKTVQAKLQELLKKEGYI